MDVYRPAGPGSARPALIIFLGRANPFSAQWARVAASKGLVAINPDLRFGSQAGDFDALTAHLVTHGAEYGMDPSAIAVYAASGGVDGALPIVEDPKRTAIKAGVMYYGDAPVTEFRRDLPLLFVRAGLDRPEVNSAASSGTAGMAARAIVQNVPVTIINYAGGHHGFELTDDDIATRDVIDQTIDFVKRATSPAYQASIRRTQPQAIAAGYVIAGRFEEAADAYAPLVAQHPEDALLGLSYGEALIGAKRFATACSAFAPLKDRGLGRRDLGLPAARACLQAGDTTTAITWLQSIPKRNLPPRVHDEPTFASLRGKPEFEAMFRSP